MSTKILKNSILLWSAWWGIVSQLRPAFSRKSTFLWFAASLAAVCVRPDLRGVTSFVRALGLQRRCYERFLDFFHSSAVKLPELRASWTATVLTLLKPFLFTVNGHIVLLADGIKAPKTGRKMPGVKKLHQESQNNSKPEYIFGHSCQAIAVVVHAASSFLAVPLATMIHEGVVFSNRDKRTLLDKLILLLVSIARKLLFTVGAHEWLKCGSESGRKGVGEFKSKVPTVATLEGAEVSVPLDAYTLKW